MTEGKAKRIAMVAAGVTLAGVAAGSIKSATDRLGRGTSTRTLTIGRDASQTYEAWPRFLSEAFETFAELTPRSDGTTSWRLHAPLATTCETRITEERVNEVVRWASDSAKPFGGALQLRAAPGGRGTEATLTLTGPFPRVVAGAVLRRFKSLVECGEVPTLACNPSGRS